MEQGLFYSPNNKVLGIKGINKAKRVSLARYKLTKLSLFG